MIKGIYYDGKTSSSVEAELTYDDVGFVQIRGIIATPVAIADLGISSRIGNTPRYIRLPDGGQFETVDNDAVDEMIQLTQGSGFSIHRLESAKRFVATTVVVVVVFAWIFVQYGIPFFAKQVAYAMPDEVATHLGDGVLENMDDHLFSESRLSKKRRARLQKLFNRLAAKIDNTDHLKLLFRDGGMVGANAFALPDGTIVMTDQLVKLTKNDNEVGSVMLHEIGHVQERHSLRLAAQSFGLAMFVMVVTGDVSTSSSIISAIPVVLVESGYSQDMEWEADGYALDYMFEHKIDPIHFANMMQKLEDSHAVVKQYNKSQKNKKKRKNDKECKPRKDKDSEDSFTDYLSSHPATKKRIDRFREASKALKAG